MKPQLADTNSGVDSPNQSDKLFEIVTVTHYGAWREEIEIELGNEDGKSYNGTVTMTEAKDGMHRDYLGFCDFKNFDGVRFSYKGTCIVTLKLKDQIDIDKLIG